MRKLHISFILKEGCTLKAVKVRNNERNRKLIEHTMEEQRKIIELKNKPFENLTVTI